MRTGPAKRMAGWNRGAKQNPIPTSSMHRATPAGPRSATTPSASSTSAAPTAEDEARPPCLHTLAPVAATTRAAMVETLMLRSRSPPVPQVSTTSMPSGRPQGKGVGHHGPHEAGHLLHRLALGPEGHEQRRRSGRGWPPPPSTCPSTTSAWSAVSEVPAAGVVSTPGHDPATRRLSAGPAIGQSHHRSWPSTPRAMRPSCTCEVPSTMVSCLASRYQSSVGWSSM